MSEPQEIRATDVVILMIGGTGSGRSTFVNALLPRNAQPMEVGSTGSLKSCTMRVEHRIVDEAPFIAGTGIDENVRVVLVDTPGFNREKQPDSEALNGIAEWARQRLPKDGSCRGGIVILHDVTLKARYNQGLSDVDITTLRRCFKLTIATSKWKLAEGNPQVIHDDLSKRWKKLSGCAKFHKFQESSDALAVIKDALTQVQAFPNSTEFSAMFNDMAARRREQEKEEKKENEKEAKEIGFFKKLFRSFAFWKR